MESTPTTVPHQVTEPLTSVQSTAESTASNQGEGTGGKKRRNHRAGKRKKARRQSFLATTEEHGLHSGLPERPAEPPTSATARPSFYKLANSGGKNLSGTSISSEALLDHR